jgi:diadenylate cyclase
MGIFDPHSPGHDGSLIIMNGRLVRYGVRLPVSQSNRLSGRFGTRHQAALGLSEVSDALVLVVSEERGTINLFYQGKVSPIGTKVQLLDVDPSTLNLTLALIVERAVHITPQLVGE